MRYLKLAALISVCIFQTASALAYRKLSQCFAAYGEKCVCYFSVSVWRDSGRRNYPMYLKFGMNAYVLCKICCIVFGVRCSNIAQTGMHKIISIHCGLLGNFVSLIIIIIILVKNEVDSAIIIHSF